MVVLRWLTGGQPPLTVVGHCRSPPLTVVDLWSGGGFGDDVGTVIMLCGIDHRVTHVHLMIGMSDGRMAKDRFVQSSIQPITLRLIGTRQRIRRQYNLPTASKVAALIPGDELPSKVDDPIAFNVVRSHMMHGPCGELYKSASCPNRVTVVIEGQRNETNNSTTTTNISNTTYSFRMTTNSNTTPTTTTTNNTTTTTTNNTRMSYAAISQHQDEIEHYLSYVYQYISEDVMRKQRRNRLIAAERMYNANEEWSRFTSLIVLSVASSGITSLLLPGGRTAHLRFCIPIELDNESCCGINVVSDLENLIRVADLIIWDEAPLQHRHAFEVADQTFYDICRLDNPNDDNQVFGGEVVVLTMGDGRLSCIALDGEDDATWITIPEDLLILVDDKPV
nr:uncharacterized protein [Tanacetum cinerariifolium]